MALRIILTTGGTGGHIFPALAVAEALRRKRPDAEILFIGGLYGPEKELAEKAGVAFVGLPVRGFIGRGFKALSAL
ncbi:MAG: glycosyltransferase, partial [Mailhella sp.]|nr:glycosyltransferase [Mailhella sp.]